MAKKILIFCLIILILCISFEHRTKASSSGTNYARGEIYWLIQRKWIGGKVTFANPNPDYIASSNLGHINQTLWVITNNGNLVQDSVTGQYTYTWVEVGYTRGWSTSPSSYDPNVRSLYTAVERPVGGIGYYSERLSPWPVGNPGTVHNYVILYDNSQGVWKVYIDEYYDSYSTQPLYAQNISIGLEDADINGTSASEVKLQNMGYYYEGQGWYSYGLANPHITNTDPNHYYFEYTNSAEDAAKDGKY